MKKRFNKQSRIDCHYIVYDCETGHRNPYEAEIIELSAIVIDYATLEPKQISFNKLILPTNWDLVQDEALQKNKITREELKEKGVDQKIVFEEFINFCRQYQKSDTIWDGLIPVTYNGVGFDHILMSKLCFKYNYLEKGRPKLFHPFHYFDVAEIMRIWFHFNDELSSYSMDNVRDYLGIKPDQAHRAMSDVMDTYRIFKRFIEFHRKLSPKYIDKFKGCFSNE